MPFQIVDVAPLSVIVHAVCDSVGHPKPADVAGSSDSAIQQMVWAVNASMGELYAMRDWQELERRGTISVVRDAPGQQEKGFPFPLDFGRFIDQTQWVKEQLWPAIGPVSPQGWMRYVIQSVGATITLSWQVRNNQLYFLYPPAVPQTFEFFYITRGWVKDADDPTLFKNIASKNGDVFVFDPALLISLSRVKYLEYKGFDSTAAMKDYLTIFDSRAGNSKGAPVLNAARRSAGIPLLSVGNLPQTGYGQ